MATWLLYLYILKMTESRPGLVVVPVRYFRHQSFTLEIRFQIGPKTDMMTQIRRLPRNTVSVGSIRAGSLEVDSLTSRLEKYATISNAVSRAPVDSPTLNM